MILEIISFNFIAKTNSLQGADIVNSSNALSGFLYERQAAFVHYFQLKSENKDLLSENTRLHNEVARLKFNDTLQNMQASIPVVTFDSLKTTDSTRFVARRDSMARVDSPSKPAIAPILKRWGDAKVQRYDEYTYIAARVINNSVVNDKNNFITINKGSLDGIEKDMAVVSDKGIVGRVVNVSKHYATVISMLSSRSVSSQIAGGNLGMTNWTTNSPEYVVMSQVDIRTKVRKGDTAYTTSYSVFPEYIPIGYVTKIDTYKVNNSLNLTLRLANNFRNLKYVYVAKSMMGKERKELEAATEAANKATQEANNKAVR